METPPKKIAFVIDSFAGGGAERVLSRVLAEIDRRRFQPSLLLLLRPEQVYSLPEDISVSYLGKSQLSLPLKSLFFSIATIAALPQIFSLNRFRDARDHIYKMIREIAGASLSLRAALQPDPPDAVVVFLSSSIIVTLLTLLIFRIPIPVCCSDRIFLSQEKRNLRYPGIVSLMLRVLYRRVQRYIAVSEAVGQDMASSFGVPSEKIVTIYNGVDIELLRRLAFAPPEHTDLGELRSDVFTVVSSGRLAVQKGHDLLLQAFSRMRRELPCRLVILGEGELLGDLERLAVGLGIADDVTFAGWQENPFRSIASADLFVLPSRYEGFPNALLEAMALGLPVIATDCPSGPAEILDGGRYGLLVPLGDPESLAAAMLTLARNSAKREEYARRSSERAATFSLSRMVASYEALLDDLVAGGRNLTT
ncbi:MAG: glycosyltransferase [Deltaproteobacteria bacterium]|nr:glycosyltransferase [Deltaproteobacteria bacterium]